MAKKKSIKKEEPKIDIPEIKKEVVEEEYILTKDVNHTLKKGMKVSKEKHDQLVNNGFGFMFE